MDKYKLITLLLLFNLAMGLTGTVLDGNSLAEYLEGDSFVKDTKAVGTNISTLKEEDTQAPVGSGVQEATGGISILASLGVAIKIFWLVFSGIWVTYITLLQPTGNILFNVVGIFTAIALMVINTFLLLNTISYIRKGE